MFCLQKTVVTGVLWHRENTCRTTKPLYTNLIHLKDLLTCQKRLALYISVSVLFDFSPSYWFALRQIKNIWRQVGEKPDICSCRHFWIRIAASGSSGQRVLWVVLSWTFPEPTKHSRRDKNIPPSALPNGAYTSDGLTHTSVGSLASALRAAYTQIHTRGHTSARPQLCSCE